MPQITIRRAGDGRLIASGDPVCALGHPLAERHGVADGVHAGWTWTGAELQIENDRYGLFPMFVATTAHRCTVVSDLTLALDAGAPNTLDYDALSVFLRLGFFVGDDTPFSCIRAVPPNAVLHWTDSGPRLTCRYPIPKSPLTLTRDDAIDAFIVHMNDAIASRLSRRPFALPLGGGCESRHILFALVAARCAPEVCLTVEESPPRSDGDVAVAAILCARLGIPHVRIPQLADRGRQEREKNRRTHFCADEHAPLIALADYLREATDVTYDGIGGDFIHPADLPSEIHAYCDRGDEAAVAACLLDEYGTAMSEDALSQLLSPDVLREVPRERAIARLRREIRRHLDAPNPVASFLFWNRTRRAGALAPYGLMRDITVHAPFLDAGVFDLIAALPATMLMDGAFHVDAIARAYPRLADVPYEPRCHRTAPRAWPRRLARDLIRDVLHAPSLRVALLPSAVATVVDGDADRLWYAPVAIYLAQLGVLAERRR